MTRVVVVIACCCSCFPVPKVPTHGLLVNLAQAPVITTTTDVGFTAGVLARHGFNIEMASRDANIVNT